MSFDHILAYRNFFPKYPSIFLRYIRYIRKIKLPIYPWLPIFSSLLITKPQHSFPGKSKLEGKKPKENGKKKRWEWEMMEIYGRKAYRRRIRKKRGSSMVLNHQSCSISDSIVGLNKKSFVIFIIIIIILMIFVSMMPHTNFYLWN